MHKFTDASPLSRICCYYVLLLFSTYVEAQDITMDRFIGVNTLRGNTVERMKAFGFVREYHEWALDEGYPALNGLDENASPAYPNNLYKWNPSYQSQTPTQFDEFYNAITSAGILLVPDLIQSVPIIADPNVQPQTFEVERILERAPFADSEDPTDPYAYLERADYLYHFAARFGRTAFSPQREQAIIAPKLHPDETIRTGYGYALYLEDWNEQDKWWHEQFDPDKYATTYFEPAEYAAMLSADYDGHGSNMGQIADPDDPNSLISAVGIKNADPSMKVVMGGLSDLDLDYLKDMVAWFNQGRDTLTNADLYPFDVINFHHYSDNNPNLRQIGAYGISPEADKLRAQLELITAYRDANFPNKELWLSEFGYDTNTRSEQRVPYAGINTADRYEVQGQWLVRAYLEIAAAGFDRAMAFTLEDVCDPPTPENNVCGLFNNSGLILNDEFNNQPKKSWYYTYTMKNALRETVFAADLSPAIVDGTDCATDIPRVYRFDHVSVPDYSVYALWSPTTCDKTPYNFTLDIGSGTQAKLTELSAPSIVGQQTALNVNTSGTTNTISVAISERPVFVVVGNFNPIQSAACVTGLQKLHETCDAVRVIWDNSSAGERVQVWYQEGHGLTAGDFDIFTATLAADDIPVSNGEYLVNDLLENTNYTFFVLTSNAQEQLSEPCLLEAMTVTATCKIPIDPAWIFTNSQPEKDLTQLFDEQADSDPICDEDPPNPTNFWLDGNPQPPASVSVDLQDYYYVDAVYLFDDFDFGDVLIEYSLSPNGPWTTLLEYETVLFKRWVSFTNLIPSDQAVRFLRFTGAETNRSRIGEFFLCGRVAPVDDTFFPPGTPVGLTATGASCNSVDLSWNAPFDADISHYEVKITGGDPIIVAPNGGLDTTVFNLATATEYTFSVTTVDLDSNPSNPAQINFSTLPATECTDDCDYSCACYICLKESWITNLTVATGIDPTNLVDEQASIDPLCNDTGTPTSEWGENYNGNEGVPPMIATLDLQRCHKISRIELFDAPGSGQVRIEYLDNENQWQIVENYETVGYEVWYEISDLDFSTRFLRFTKLENQAKINEIAICGFPLGCELCPTPAQLTADADSDGDGVIDDCDICPGFDDTADADLDGIPDGCDTSCDFLPGDPCNDNDDCTINDQYDADCNCAGTFQDSDDDGVCNAEDQCPGLPDTDANMNGTPDACETDCSGFMVTAATTSVSCTNRTDGAIDLLLPVCNDAATSGTTIDNITTNGTVSQSSTNSNPDSRGLPVAERAVDGDTNGIWFASEPDEGRSISSTAYQPQPWWELDLGSNFQVDTVKIYWRTDACCPGNIYDYYLLTSSNPFGADDLNTLLQRNDVNVFPKAAYDPNNPNDQPRPETFVPQELARYVRIQLDETAQLQIAEVELFGQENVECNYSFTWNDATLNGTEDPTNLASGDYRVTVVNFMGCEQILDINVPEPAALGCNAEVVRAISTVGGNDGAVAVTTTGGTAPFAVMWNDPSESTTTELDNLAAGSYGVLVTDANGCECFAFEALNDPGGDPNPPTNYCSATGENTDDDFINSVQIGDLSNSSAGEGYGNFTNLRTLVELGATYDLEVSPSLTDNTATYHWSIYADWNRNGDFTDSDETITTASAMGMVTLPVTIPVAAEIGGTVLRIMLKKGTLAAEPCETVTFGEVEDYTLHIVPSGAALALPDEPASDEILLKEATNEIKIYPNPGWETVTLSKAHWTKQMLRVQFFTSLGQQVLQENFYLATEPSVEVDLSRLEAGMYYVVVKPEQGRREVLKWVKL